MKLKNSLVLIAIAIFLLISIGSVCASETVTSDGDVQSADDGTDVVLSSDSDTDGNVADGNTNQDLTNTICVILTFDRNVSAFMKTGEAYEPNTSRRHNITDSIALTTFFTLNNPIQNYDTDAITLRYKAIISSIVYYSVIQNFGNSILLKSIQNVGDSQTYGQIQISNKINIKNNQTDLLTVLNGLIDVIKEIKTTQGTLLHDDSKAALETYKSTIGTLLN